MKVVFLSGPYRGPTNLHTQDNINRALNLAAQVWQAGHAALCPHTNAPLAMVGTVTESQFIDGDLAMLRKCDAVLMTSDWRNSSGATEEHREALRAGIPVYYSMEELRRDL